MKAVFGQFNELVGDFMSEEASEAYPLERLTELNNELSKVEKLLKKKKAMYENDIIDIDELISSTTELREKEKELIQEIKNIQKADKQNDEVLKSIIENIETLWVHANDYERKQLMTTIFTQLVIDTKDDYQCSKQAREIIIVSSK